MRWGMSIICALVFTGCANEAPQPVTAPPEPVYEDAVAASLVYEPPVTLTNPRVEIGRAGRANEAYAGFEDVVSTYYWLRMDDRQLDYGRNGRTGRGWSGDRLERRAISTRVGVTHR